MQNATRNSIIPSQMVRDLISPLPPNRLTVKEECFVRQCVDVVITHCELYNFDTLGYERKTLYAHWIYCAAVIGCPITFVKWKLAAYFAYHAPDKQDAVPSVLIDLGLDQPSCLLTGRGYSFLRYFKHHNSDLFGQFVNGVRYCKKGLPKPDEQFVRRAMKKAFIKLTTKPVSFPPNCSIVPWSEISEQKSTIHYQLNRENLKAEIKRTVIESLPGLVYTDLDRINPSFPSTRANNSHSVKMGGAVGLILDHPKLLEHLKFVDELILTVRRKGHSYRSESLLFDSALLELSFLHLYNRMRDLAYSEKAVVTLVGFSEALKARIISKGPAITYTVLKPLQKLIHSKLRQHPCYALIGETITPEYIQDRMGSKLAEHQKFLSIDYSDATNEMYSFVSDYVVDEINNHIVGLEDGEKAAFKRSLTGHHITMDWTLEEFLELLREPGMNEEKLLGYLDGRPQENGQLMGSIMSFPILCIANAAVCRWAKEVESKRVWTLRDCPLAVNGDDGIMKGTNELRRIHELISTFCGLKPSPGKVYFSEKFLDMNSTTFWFHPEGYEDHVTWNRDYTRKVTRWRHFEHRKYVNMGLLLGVSKSEMIGEKAEQGDQFQNLNAIALDLERSVPHQLRDKVLTKYYNKNIEFLKKVKLPWCIPEYLGGLGLPEAKEEGKEGFAPSDLDLRLARKMYDHPKLFPIPAKPLRVPWKVWKYAVKRFPTTVLVSDFIETVHAEDQVFSSTKLVIELGSGKRKFSTEETLNPNFDLPFHKRMFSTNDLRSLACVEAIFRSKGLAEMYGLSKKQKRVDPMKYYESIQEVRKKALLDKLIPLPEPYSTGNYPIPVRHIDDIPIYAKNYRRINVIPLL